MSVTVTVVIPTLNEAERLPALLENLQSQSRPPKAVVVADAGSTDDTVALAEKAGARVVPGGMPARGRNAGAAVAETDLVFFLDADVMPDLDFLELAIGEFVKRKLDAATALITPLEKDARFVLACDVTNLYLQVIGPVSPRAPGFCILVRKELHDRIGGFDESVVMAEDHEYAHRAHREGSFGVLTSVKIPVSMRRIEKEGLVRLAFKYFYCEMYAMTGTPIRSVPFQYEFGAFQPSEKTAALVDVGAVRSQLGSVATSIKELAEPSRRALAKLGSTSLGPSTFEEMLEQLPTEDVGKLERYLRRRIMLMPRRARRSIRKLSDVIWLRENNGD